MAKFAETAKRVFGGRQAGRRHRHDEPGAGLGRDRLPPDRRHLFGLAGARRRASQSCAASRPTKGPMGGKGGIAWIEITSTVNNPDLSPLAVRVPRIRAAAGDRRISWPSPKARSIRWPRWAIPSASSCFTHGGAGRDPVGQPGGGDERVGRVRHRARLRQGARPDDGGQAGARLTSAWPRLAAAPADPAARRRRAGRSASWRRSTASTSTVREGEFFTVVGPSGSGKTTLLRMLAGMETPSDGDILLRGKRINDLPANRRPTCLVFQSLALFPHRSVGQNIEFPLKMKGIAAGVRRERALELMRMVRLPEDYYGKNVTQVLGRRAAAGRPGPGLRLRPGDPVLRRAAVGDRLQAQESPRAASSRTSTRKPARPSCTSPTASRRRW